MKRTKITTPSDLAKALDIDPAQVTRYTRRADWRFSRTGPWTLRDVAAIQRWRADNLKQGAPEKRRPINTRTARLRDEKLEAEVRKLRAQADQAEVELRRQCGELMEASAVREEWSQIGRTVRVGLQSLASAIVPDALALGMPMSAAAEFHQKTEARILGTMRAMSEAGRKSSKANKAEDDTDKAETGTNDHEA